MSTLQLISFRAQQVVLDDAGTDPHSLPPIPHPPALLPAVCSPLSSFTALSYPLVVPLDSASESASGSAAGSAGPTHTVLVPSRRSRFHGVHPPFRSRARGGWW